VWGSGMRLCKVTVTGLFGIFDHEIPLNLEERITIVHGPNGFGKTALLRMVNGLLGGDYTPLAKYPFDTFALSFDDGSVLAVARTSEKAIGRDISELEVSLAHPHREPHRARLHPDGGVLPWLRSIIEEVSVSLVLTQRLDRRNSAILTVQEYSTKICMAIGRSLAEYAARSQELDRTFPARLLQNDPSGLLSPQEIQERLRRLEERRAKLAELGFLDAEEGLRTVSEGAIQQRRDVLSVYVNDSEAKLAALDELAQKLELFTRIINDRFMFKRMSIARAWGLVFTSVTGARIALEDLSSGEQHQIVLLYELLFKLRPGSLVLIDEPEISLHVAWQEKFLDDLRDIVAITGIDVIVATHSPEIIGDHWDLTIELKPPAHVTPSAAE
jgi:predicted ATP-binding protein involved in virulence